MSDRIIVLDGHTLTPNTPGNLASSQDPTWDALAALGSDIHVYPRTLPEDIISHADDAPILFTNKVPFTADTIVQLPNLKYIGVLATGYNIIDLEAATDAGITVTNAAGYSTPSVAQHVFALILELLTHTASHGLAVHQGHWTACPDFTFTVQPTTELAGKSIGIVGLGTIGRTVAKIAHAFGMNVLAPERPSSASFSQHGLPVNFLPLKDLIAQSDILSLHCPLTSDTHHLINKKTLKLMKPSAILINTGRGPLIDESALAEALKQGQIAGAGLDVLSAEPPTADNPLIGAPRTVITPHIAWATRESRLRLMDIVTNNLRVYLAGNPVNVVN
ncbi:Glycerate dehydrogenase [Poriferisphaera corsica]|uniref:Glycerate dehydrogenase n=1 Tax=Poriferisphaera corsica TaxID=2528020 RepID=A0A517YUB6_9BACT|nr:D-2-hydroxyacid dehydrogenase [Poriferisphaera corsica]QDU33806.1 Glycerate dehydrogenase [Poriferisphaera corsica]